MVESCTSLPQLLEQLRRQVDAALDRYTQLPAGCPDRLREAIRYSLLTGGKRLRPVLVLTAAEACGSDYEVALPAACAVEMIHTYSLIHDDLPAMDDDDLRRGHPTCHKVFGEGMAILAGDALLTLAFEVVAKNGRQPVVVQQCLALLAEAAGACHLVGGQAADLEAEQHSSGDLAELESIHARKTGAMLMVSLKLGGVCAGADLQMLETLETYGRCIGLAFQISDDLLDVQGSEQELGKRVRKDQQRGKLTFPGLLGIEKSRQRADELVAQACHALQPLGASAGNLEALARYVVERNH